MARSISFMLVFIAVASALPFVPSAKEPLAEKSGVLCELCDKAADEIVNVLLNYIMKAGVVGGCADLCSHLNNTMEAKVCDVVCSFAGEAAFVEALKHVQLNPKELCTVLHVCNNSTQINQESLIRLYNSVRGGTWKAGSQANFDGWTFDEAKQLCGTLGIGEKHALPVTDNSELHVGDIPSDFDARVKWKGLIHPIRNQERCGSCWAFSASEVLSDRFAIQTNKSSPALSPEDLVSCDTSDHGCQGGMLPNVWAYMTQTGICTDTCFPYTAGNGTAAPCTHTCKDGKRWLSYQSTGGSQVTTVAGIQKEIMTNGPVQTGFMVYKSFMSYKSGVYKKHWWEFLESPLGGHAVKIIGWGTENKAPYWLVANSWGPTWGLNGFFKIKRGDDQCKIESDVFAGKAKLY